jgi:hypothetical protein
MKPADEEVGGEFEWAFLQLISEREGTTKISVI